MWEMVLGFAVFIAAFAAMATGLVAGRRFKKGCGGYDKPRCGGCPRRHASHAGRAAR